MSRKKECNLGNFIADAMVHHWVNVKFLCTSLYIIVKFFFQSKKKKVPDIGIMNSGGIRGDLMFGNITYADMLTVVKI